MSGFSAEWLALREGADVRARNPQVRAACAAYLGDRPAHIVDLGCGAGSNLRGLAPYLGPEQYWHLVDYDPALLAAAKRKLMVWSERAETQGAAISLLKSGKSIIVTFEQADLSAGIGTILARKPDLITAAALFDLVSEVWIADFVARIAAAGLAFHPVLTYDGQESWTPPHEYDADMLEAFQAHQQTDKGFGRAAGPQAAAILESHLRKAGYIVTCGQSPWILGPEHEALSRELAKGIAQAVRETQRVERAAIDGWLQARSAGPIGATIGHVDLFARPVGA